MSLRRGFNLHKFTYILQAGVQRSVFQHYEVKRRFSKIIPERLTLNISSLQIQQPFTWCAVRTYASKAKTKDKKKESAGSKTKIHVVDLNPEDYEDIIDLENMKSKMQAALDHLKTEYVHNLSLRNSISAFEHLTVNTSDGKFSVNQLGQVMIKNPQLVVINMSASPQHTEEVVEVIKKSGITTVPPQQDGFSIAITIPRVTRERREELAKSAKKLCQKTKDVLNDHYVKECKVAKKAKHESWDLIKDIEQMLLQTKNSFVEEAENMNKVKEKELLGE